MPGLLSYREDNEKLYLNKGNKWDAIGSEKEVGKSGTFSDVVVWRHRFKNKQHFFHFETSCKEIPAIL